MYDPAVGRFIQQDPTGFDAGDPNLYRYVSNDPTNLVDLTGTTDHGKNGGQLFIDPGFVPPVYPPGVQITRIDEDYEGKLKKNPGSNIQTPIFPDPGFVGPPYLPVYPNQTPIYTDAVLVPGVGMFKLRNGSKAILTKDPKTGLPTVVTKEPATRLGIPIPNLFFPVGQPNPFFTDIPGGPDNEQAISQKDANDRAKAKEDYKNSQNSVFGAK